MLADVATRILDALDRGFVIGFPGKRAELGAPTMARGSGVFIWDWDWRVRDISDVTGAPECPR